MLSRQDIYLHLFLLCFLRKCSAVTVTVDDVNVAEGSEARITCNIVPASSGAVPVVTWYNVTNGANDLIANYQGGFGAVEPGYSDKFSVENDITLVITNTHRSDSGTYQCSVNLVGDSPSVDDDICTLTVNYLDKPEINFLTLVTEGDEVVLTCVVDSSPEAMCNFIKDDDVLPHDGSCTFTITSASRADDGSYECEADNGVGNKQKSDNRNLEVEFTPVANDDNDINDQIVYPGETVTMTFSGIANPPDLTYLWTTDLPGNEDAVNNGSTFTVKVSESEIHGAFYFINLTVTNSIGSTTYSAKITVSVKNSIMSTVLVKTTSIPITVKNSIMSTVSVKTTSIPITKPAAESCNDTTGLTIGMFFVGIIIGSLGFYIAEITHNKIKKKSLLKKQDAEKRKQDTYMDYVVDTGEQNQTYQDLQHRVEESAYVNVNAGNKNKKGKV